MDTDLARQYNFKRMKGKFRFQGLKITGIILRKYTQLLCFWNCDRLNKKIVRRPCVRPSTFGLLTLKRLQFWANFNETWSECLSWQNVGHTWIYVTWGQKLGHQVKYSKNLVNTLEVTVLNQFLWNFVRMFDLTESMSFSNLCHVGSKTRSQGEILESSFILYRP